MASRSWEQTAASAAQRLKAYEKEVNARRGRALAARVFRVNQLDSFVLDGQVKDILLAQAGSVLSALRPGADSRWQPELEAAVSALLFACTLWRNVPTPGSKLQNVRYRSVWAAADRAGWPCRLQRAAHGLLTVGGRWAVARARRHMLLAGWADAAEGSWKKRLHRLLTACDRVYRVASTVHLLLFLARGRYTGIVDRLTGMRLVYERPAASRSVSFDYINRQLLWDGFSDLILFMLPLVDWDLLIRWGRRLLPRVKASKADCPICAAPRPSNAYRTNCGHVYCYYCLKTECMADSKLTCRACGQLITSSAPVAAAKKDA